jgi:hypothetical protein
MRLKNAISGMLLLALGLCVGSAVAILAMAFGGIGPSKLHHSPAIVTFDHNWNITGIVTQDHHSNITGGNTNDTPLRNGQPGGRGTSIAKPPPGSRGKVDAAR